MKIKPLVTAIILVAVGAMTYVNEHGVPTAPTLSQGQKAGEAQTLKLTSDERLTLAFEQKENDLQVMVSGKVIKLLADDNEGSRHQKFLLRLSNGQTLLVAHNIDLAPRLDTLREGATVTVHGEYEWNPRGGVIHWTHHDPNGMHEGGWIEFDGRRYE